MIVEDFKNRIFSLDKSTSPQEGFRALALEAFEFQREHCKVYREFLDLIGKGDFHPSSPEEIPFLPIRFFKSRDVVSAPAPGNGIVFTSSATTGMVPSHHIVHDISVYEKSFTEGFRLFYGESGTYNLLALLPSYLERKLLHRILSTPLSQLPEIKCNGEMRNRFLGKIIDYISFHTSFKTELKSLPVMRELFG